MDWKCFSPRLGIDYNWGAGEQDKGKPIFSIANGIVKKIIKWDGKTKGFGNHVFIKHILGFNYELDGIKFKKGDVLYSHYCHLDEISCKKGQIIGKGDKIGTCGGSGGWPSHLHIELRKEMGKGYNFWPAGYSAEWIKKRYFDIYKFIEDNKGGNMPNELRECLKLHSELVDKCNRKDKEIRALENDLRKKNEDLEKANKNTTECNGEIVDLKEKIKNKLKEGCNKEIELALKNKEGKHKIAIVELKSKITDLENSKEYRLGKTLVKVFNKITLKRSKDGCTRLPYNIKGSSK